MHAPGGWFPLHSGQRVTLIPGLANAVSPESIPAHLRRADTATKLFSLVVLCAPLRNPQRPALKKERRIRDTNNPLPELRAEPKPKDCCAVGLGRFGQFFDADFQAEHLQAANEVFALLPGMVAIKVITAE